MGVSFKKDCFFFKDKLHFERGYVGHNRKERSKYLYKKINVVLSQSEIKSGQKKKKKKKGITWIQKEKDIQWIYCQLLEVIFLL